jgi:hypothetical protein
MMLSRDDPLANQMSRVCLCLQISIIKRPVLFSVDSSKWISFISWTLFSCEQYFILHLHNLSLIQGMRTFENIKISMLSRFVNSPMHSPY